MTEAQPIRIVVLGDSITKGDQVGEAYRFTTLVQQSLSSKLKRSIVAINSGVNADITPLALHRVNRDVIAHRPHYCVIMFGVNDAGFYRPETPEKPGATPRVALSEFQSCLRAIADKVRAASSQVIFATPVPMSKHYWLAHLPQYQQHGLNYLVDQYAQRVRDVAKEEGAPLIDVYYAFRSRPETEDFVPDGIHPDKRGHDLIAAVYERVLLPLLAK